MRHLVAKIELLTDPKVTGIYNIHRFFVDLLKWEEYAADSGSLEDERSLVSLLAKRMLRFEVVNAGNHGVHAEMRILSQLIDEGIRNVAYIGISKLSCAHCHMLLSGYASLIQPDRACSHPIARGTHAIACNWDDQTFSWVLKSLNERNKLLLPILGRDLYEKFTELQGKTVHLKTKKGKVLIPEMNALDFAISLIEKMPAMSGKAVCF